MFVIDSLIGNTDRHNGNWGFLLDKNTMKIEFAPIYDCGSCFNPLYEDEEIENISDNELKNLAMNCYSCLKENGKRISYMSYIKSMKNEDCNAAIYRLFRQIDVGRIISFIDNMEGISEIRKSFYKSLIVIRYEVIKDVYYKCLEKY